ncbi:MAG: dihydroorotate dehydrogenase electron transfer subunit [Bacteroidales bacterium]|nr:dihydroorotate dehydrogenase electron transfer subunit [Bacteroidales bacterium]
MKYFESTVESNIQITDDIYVMTVLRHEAKASAGQFFMLKCWDKELTLMRPISVYQASEEHLLFMYRLVGEGTRKLAALKNGDSISLLGALGNGYPLDQIHGRIAVVGGGVGIPPLSLTTKMLQAQGETVDAYLGYRDEIFAVEAFEPYCRDIFISSEKGPEGYRGFITDLLKAEQYDAVLTCGPEVMMRKVAQICSEKNVTCWCSMEHRMACGIGACLGCSIPTTEGMRRVCKDGPVFLASHLFQK